MNRSEFVRYATDVLRNNDVKKPISIPKQIFHISDDDGNTKDFSVKKVDKTAIYTIKDVDNILSALLCVIVDAMSRGESITIHGIGTLGMKLREARALKHVKTGEWISVPAHYVPKFDFGKEIQRCARVYNLSIGTDADVLSSSASDLDGDDDE